MTFSFIGGGGSGSGVAVWQYMDKDFSNLDPDPNKYIEIWDPNDPLLPEPASAHVLVYAKAAWMNKAAQGGYQDYPPACGSSFGYKHYSRGEVPQKVYAWKGRNFGAYPYDYTDQNAYFGFNIGPSKTGALMLPNCGAQSYFFQSDFIAPDAENNNFGDWTKIFNGGNGHYYDDALQIDFHDGPGSSGSIFGRGYNGDIYPAGSGGPGTATARGPEATHMAKGVMDELGLLKLFVKGKAADRDHADNGDYQVVLPPDLFLFGQLPFDYNTSLLKLPVSTPPPNRKTIPNYSMVFAVILEFKE